MRDLLLSLHIIGVAAWLGANFTQIFASNRLTKGNDAVALAWHQTSLALGRTYYNVAGALITVTGILLVFEGDWEWSSAFISIGFATVIIGGLVGFLFFIPTSEQAIEAIEKADTTQATLMSQRSLVGAIGDTALVVLTIFAMVGKWGV